MVVSDVPRMRAVSRTSKAGCGCPSENRSRMSASPLPSERARLTAAAARCRSRSLSNASAPVRRQVTCIRPRSGRRRARCGRATWSVVSHARDSEGLPAVRVRLSDDSLRRDNEVVLAEPRPQTVAVENRLPDGRGATALVQALDALSGVTRPRPDTSHSSTPVRSTKQVQQTPGASVSDARRPRGWPAASRRTTSVRSLWRSVIRCCSA